MSEDLKSHLPKKAVLLETDRTMKMTNRKYLTLVDSGLLMIPGTYAKDAETIIKRGIHNATAFKVSVLIFIVLDSVFWGTYISRQSSIAYDLAITFSFFTFMLFVFWMVHSPRAYYCINVDKLEVALGGQWNTIMEMVHRGESMYEQARKILEEQALVVIRSQQACPTSSIGELNRLEFGTKFKIFQKFELIKEDKWDAYFATAQKRYGDLLSQKQARKISN